LSPSHRAAVQRAALAVGVAVTDPNRDGDVILISNPNRRNGCATMMKIYNFARGARGQRVMWLCEEMGLSYAVQNLSFPVATDYRALNPLGTVPFLEDAGGVALNESVAIMLYLAQRYGPTPFLPVLTPSRQRLDQNSAAQRAPDLILANAVCCHGGRLGSACNSFN
jgi:hypothetical protein